MRHFFRSLTVASIFACSIHTVLFAQENVSAARRKFIKGNIADKTTAVREASGTETALAETGLDFVIENQPVLGNDRELSALAIASILALQKGATQDKTSAARICEKLLTVFSQSSDDTVRIAVLDKLVPLVSSGSSANAVTVLNTFLTDTAASHTAPSPVIAATLASLSAIGNSDSFSIVYAIWKNNQWPQNSDDIERALAQLSLHSVTEAIKAVNNADLPETKAYFSVLQKRLPEKKEFIAEIAENVLSKTLYNAESFSNELAELQLTALAVIADAHWTRASKLVIRYFSVAADQYKAGVLHESQFSAVIADVAKLASPDSASTLSAYLAELNSQVSANAVPAKEVVLAVITGLGNLGDKTAFDALLYVTYLSYPEDVIQAAREALARLKW